MHGFNRFAVVVASAVTFAACSDSGRASESTSPSSTAQTSSTASTTTIADTTTSTTTSTTTTPTTAATTVASTAGPTTMPTIEDQVRAAALRHYDTYWQCLRVPDACPLDSAWLAGSDAFDAMSQTVTDMSVNGFFVGDEDPGYIVVESVVVNADHTLVTSCWSLTGVLYLKPPVEGAEPTIQNNTPGWTRETQQFVQDADGVWKTRRGDTLELVAGENRCPPEA